jgi:hypothetical protein
MAYGKFGFPSMTNRALGNPKNFNSKKKQSGEILVRVNDIILDENHAQYNSNQGLNQIGTIIGNKANFDGTIENQIIRARPAFSAASKYPTVNEYVKAWKHITPNEPAGSWVYGEVVPVWGMLSPNVSPYPTNTTSLLPPSQQLDYTQIEAGGVNVVNNEVQQIDLNSPNSISQATFVERSNIHPLMPYMGDILYEGRWGNSIRLGSTAKSKSIFANPWSRSGTNGDPITIIRNGQDRNANEFGAEPIVENVKRDLSSIYLTSTQSLPYDLSGLQAIPYKSYTISGIPKPVTPSQFVSPQILLNSDRIVIDAQSNDVLVGANRSIGLFGGTSINIESGQINMSANDIKLGVSSDESAMQPVLKGNDTVNILLQLTNVLQGLSEVLKVAKIYPEGAIISDTASLIISGQALSILEEVEKKLKDQTNGIKSNFVKTI